MVSTMVSKWFERISSTVRLEHVWMPVPGPDRGDVPGPGLHVRLRGGDLGSSSRRFCAREKLEKHSKVAGLSS